MRHCTQFALLLLLCSMTLAYSGQFVAVLETMANGKIGLEPAELNYLTDELRAQALQELPPSAGYTIMTLESIQAMLPPGTRIEECAGDCLVQTGRNLSADFVAQARVGKFGNQLTLTVELYDTRSSQLLGSLTGRKPNAEGLLELIAQKSSDLFSKVRGGAVVTVSAPVASNGIVNGEVALVGIRFSDGPGAIVVDGKLVCSNQAVYSGELTYGMHQVVASRDGYRDSIFSITVPNGKNRYSLTLHKKEAISTVAKRNVNKNFMVRIPTGCFAMGSNAGDSDEKPVHQVCLHEFHMDKYEVTQLEFQKVMGHNPSRFKACGGNCPVDNVTWNEATDYCQKNGQRLPTEAEWEYAARAGNTMEWAWDDQYFEVKNGMYTDSEWEGSRFAWFGEDIRDHKTHPVGSKKANAWGLYDMAGNVWEWVQDWYSKDYYRQEEMQDPKGPEGGEKRVLRGGDIDAHRNYIRSANRDWSVPGIRVVNGGFRCVSR